MCVDISLFSPGFEPQTVREERRFQMLQKMGSSGGPSHLVVLFCVSAGKNGEELGSDEEQIVYLVYLLYDVTNNKVGRGHVISYRCAH